LEEPISLKDVEEGMEQDSFDTYVRDNLSLIYQILPMGRSIY